MATCVICFEEGPTDVGQLDSCVHLYCFGCILEWAQRDSRCPQCAKRFRTITHRQLVPGGKDAAGLVLEVLDIPERTQRFEGDEGEPDPMDTLVCMECGGGDDEDVMLICDGADCERGCHTYCAGLDEVPEDEWYCWECAARAAHGADARAPVSSSRRRGAGEARRGAGEAMRSASPPAGELARSRRRGPGVRQRQGQHVEGEQSVSPEAASPSSPARQRRRLVLRGAGGVDVGSVADFLDVLEARQNRSSANELPSAAHRRVEEMRRSLTAVRQGLAAAVPVAGSAAAAASPAADAGQEGSAGRQGGGQQGLDETDAAWAAWEESRRGSRGRREEGEDEDDTSSAAIRRRLARAAEEGRRLGSSGRLVPAAQQQRSAQVRPRSWEPQLRGSSRPAAHAAPRRDASPRRREVSPRRQAPPLPLHAQQPGRRGGSRWAPLPQLAPAARPPGERSSSAAGHWLPLSPGQHAAAASSGRPAEQGRGSSRWAPLSPNQAPAARSPQQPPWRAPGERSSSAAAHSLPLSPSKHAGAASRWSPTGAQQAELAQPALPLSGAVAVGCSSRGPMAPAPGARASSRGSSPDIDVPLLMRAAGRPAVAAQAPAPGGTCSSSAGCSVPVGHAATSAAAAGEAPRESNKRGPGSSEDSSTSSLALHLSSLAGHKRRREEAPQQQQLQPQQPYPQQQQHARAGTLASTQTQVQLYHSKKAAADDIKKLLKPLLHGGLVDRQQFSDAAKRATHSLYKGTARSAKDALCEALAEQGAHKAAVAVLRSA